MRPEIKKCGDHHLHHRDKGPSSFWMQSAALLFDRLDILPGQHILDLGCGAGDYTLEAARRTGPAGRVTSLDHWPPIVEAVKQAAKSANLPQVRALKGDITNPPLPIGENEVDLCMMFTVLHIFDLNCYKKALFGEMARVIRPGGSLAVLECKKEKWSFGPPLHMRLAPDEVEAAIKGWGFAKREYLDLGYNYMLCFTREEAVDS